MIHLVEKEHLLDFLPEKVWEDNDAKILAYRRGECLFVYNFHPFQSVEDYEIPCIKSKYRIVLNSDSPDFNGFGNVDESMEYHALETSGRRCLKIYMPSRTVLVLRAL